MSRAVFCLNGPDAVNGPNVWLTRHLPLLARRGIEPIVLHLSWRTEQPCRFRAELEASGIRTHPVQLTRNIEDNTIAIANAASALAPAIFVPNYSVAGYYAARFLREAGVVTIGTLHSDDAYYHDLIDVFVAGEPRWRLSGVVGVSEYLRTLVQERTGDSVPYLHAPYGAPVPPQHAVWAADRFDLVYSGRLVELQKRVTRVAAAMEAATALSPKVRGVLFGDGPERLRLTQRLAGGTSRVELGGSLSAADIQKAMLKAQAFVLLSDFEGLSIALMEAMACGLVPIVTPMRSGVSDLVRDGETGIIVPPDEPAAFARAVERLSEDEEYWRRLSVAARTEITARGFTSEACADAWVRFVFELVDRDSSPRAVVLPRPESWQMPPRSVRVDGIRLEDRRASWARIQGATADGRPVFLWGASRAGEVFLEDLLGRELTVAGFVDSDPKKRGTRFCGVTVDAPASLVARAAAGSRPFVVITSQFEAEIADALRGLGFVEDEDFVAG